MKSVVGDGVAGQTELYGPEPDPFALEISVGSSSQSNDKATMDKVPDSLRDKLGIAISQQAYKSYRDLLETDRWQRLAGHGARQNGICA